MFRAIREYIRWWSKWGGIPVASWIHAAHAYKRKNFQRAEVLYEKGIVKHPNHPARSNAILDLAYCKFRLGKPREAIALLTDIVQKKPFIKEGWMRLGRLLLWVGTPRIALKRLIEARDYFPQDMDLWGLTVYAAAEVGEDAQITGLALLDREPRNSKRTILAEVAVALALLRFKDFTQGREDLTKLCTNTESPLEAIHGIAELLIEEGNTGMAKHFLRRALSISPENPKTLALLAELYMEDPKGYEYSVQLAQKSCQVSQWMSPSRMHLLVQAHLAVGDKISALLIASRASQIDDEEYQDSASLAELVSELSSQTLS